MAEVTVFRLLRNDKTRLDNVGSVMGWGIAFAESGAFLEWNRSAFPEDERLGESHVSMYGSLEDVEQGAGGKVEIIDKYTVAEPPNSKQVQYDEEKPEPENTAEKPSVNPDAAPDDQKESPWSDAFELEGDEDEDDVLIGPLYKGEINNVKSYGIFVTLNRYEDRTDCSGLVQAEDIETGRDKTEYQPGDEVVVQAIRLTDDGFDLRIVADESSPSGLDRSGGN